MKTINIILIAVFAISINVYAETTVKEAALQQCHADFQDLVLNYNVSVDVLPLPHSSNNFACMQKVYTKGQYSLWKARAEEVDRYPHSFITGNSFNYFVYKGDRFHLTVNNYNKNDVYRFFVEMQ